MSVRSYYDEVCIDTSGNALANVEVTVYDVGTTNPVTIYTARSGGGTKANPITTGANGLVNFYADPKTYSIKFHDAQSPSRFSDRTIDWDATSGDVVTGGIAATQIERLGTSSLVKTDGAGLVTTGQAAQANLANDSVGSAQIITDAVGSTEIAPDAVGSSEIATDAVGTAEILASAVTAQKIASNAIFNTHLTDNSVSASDIQASAVTTAKLDVNAVLGGNIAANAVTATKIASDAVTTIKIIDDAVTNPKVADNAIGTAELLASSVTATKMAQGAIGTAQLATGAVTNVKYAASSVSADKLDTSSPVEFRDALKIPGLTNQNTFTNQQTIQRTADNPSLVIIRPSDAGASNMVNFRNQANSSTISRVSVTGAWRGPVGIDYVSFSPTWNNVTVGNGVVTARYALVGEICIFEVILTWGSTTSFSGTVSVNLPTTANIQIATRGWGQSVCDDASPAATYFGTCNVLSNIAPKAYVVSGTHIDVQNVNATQPFTWAVSDVLTFTGVYPAAADA